MNNLERMLSRPHWRWDYLHVVKTKSLTLLKENIAILMAHKICFFIMYTIISVSSIGLSTKFKENFSFPLTTFQGYDNFSRTYQGYANNVSIGWSFPTFETNKNPGKCYMFTCTCTCITNAILILVVYKLCIPYSGLKTTCNLSACWPSG